MTELTKEIAEKPHSVEFAVNAKGHLSGKVKIYAETGDKAMKEALEKLTVIIDLVRDKNGLN